jgi:hypothetical protein
MAQLDSESQGVAILERIGDAVAPNAGDPGQVRPCSVTIDKTCYLPLSPPSDSFGCSKPIDSLSMICNGRSSLATRSPWSLTKATSVDVVWEIFDTGGTKRSESSFQLSCSDGDMNGLEDCGKAQHDGKSNGPGLINEWILEGVIDAGGGLDTTP